MSYLYLCLLSKGFVRSGACESTTPFFNIKL